MNDLSVHAPAQSENGLPPEAGAWLTVDLGALVQNWHLLRDRAGGAECAAAVKADAYGTGLEPVVSALANAGCRTFFVAQIGEGIRARAIVPDAAIYVLNGLLPGTAPTYAAQSLRPVLGSTDEIEEWAAFCRARGEPLPAALHVDTGMNRLGLRVEDALALAGDSRLEAFTPALLMSHFASAEDPADPVNQEQIDRFERVQAALPHIPASLANSSGIFLPQHPYYDLVRPGYALYGGNPTPGRLNPMRPVVQLQGRIVQLHVAKSGERVGYNGRWMLRGDRRLATLSVGYADGLPRALSGTDAKAGAGHPAGEAIVAGRRCPFAGSVSMDLIVLDVTEVPEDALRRGDGVTLIGGDLDVDEVGRRAGTIGYEILTSLGARYGRRYVGAERKDG